MPSRRGPRHCGQSSATAGRERSAKRSSRASITSCVPGKDDREIDGCGALIMRGILRTWDQALRISRKSKIKIKIKIKIKTGCLSSSDVTGLIDDFAD